MGNAEPIAIAVIVVLDRVNVVTDGLYLLELHRFSIKDRNLLAVGSVMDGKDLVRLRIIGQVVCVVDELVFVGRNNLAAREFCLNYRGDRAAVSTVVEANVKMFTVGARALNHAAIDAVCVGMSLDGVNLGHFDLKGVVLLDMV